jgi:hypothetical protein
VLVDESDYSVTGSLGLVAEHRVPGACQAYEFATGQPVGEVLDEFYRADGVVLTGDDLDRAGNARQQVPGIKVRFLVAPVVQVDLAGADASLVRQAASST